MDDDLRAAARRDPERAALLAYRSGMTDPPRDLARALGRLYDCRAGRRSLCICGSYFSLFLNVPGRLVQFQAQVQDQTIASYAVRCLGLRLSPDDEDGSQAIGEAWCDSRRQVFRRPVVAGHLIGPFRLWEAMRAGNPDLAPMRWLLHEFAARALRLQGGDHARPFIHAISPEGELIQWPRGRGVGFSIAMALGRRIG